QVSTALAHADQAAVEALLDLVHSHVERKWDRSAAPAQIAVIAMGRQGGFEAGCGSDLDVMFVHQAAQDVAPDAATRVAVAAATARPRCLTMRTRPRLVWEPAVESDAELRSE